MTGKPLSLGRIQALLSEQTGQGTTSDNYMILRDGSHVPFDPNKVSKFTGRAGERRRLYPGSNEVVAYIVRP